MLIDKLSKNFLLVLCLLTIAFGSVSAQSKKNSRPIEIENKEKKEKIKAVATEDITYGYEFEKSEFNISKILIEHDANGIGKITFQKKEFDEDFVEPIKLSEKSLEIFNNLWTELNFLKSVEDYQSDDKDYPHLGTIKLMMQTKTNKRIAEFNWTDNKNAKALADEYRKIANQYIWIFDMNVARQNQPLESPKIMRRFDKYLKLNEISDPEQLVPYLEEVFTDERFPLITRNHAKRLLKRMKEMNKEDKTK